MKTQPMMGSGMVTKSAPNLPSIPNSIIMMPPTWTTLLLPTYNECTYFPYLSQNYTSKVVVSGVKRMRLQVDGTTWCHLMEPTPKAPLEWPALFLYNGLLMPQFFFYWSLITYKRILCHGLPWAVRYIFVRGNKYKYIILFSEVKYLEIILISFLKWIFEKKGLTLHTIVTSRHYTKAQLIFIENSCGVMIGMMKISQLRSKE